MAVILCLVVAALATACVHGLVSVLRPDCSLGIAAAVEACSARWVALGQHYAAATLRSPTRWAIEHPLA